MTMRHRASHARSSAMWYGMVSARVVVGRPCLLAGYLFWARRQLHLTLPSMQQLNAVCSAVAPGTPILNIA